MQRLIIIPILFIWILGLIQPGVWSNSFDLHKMYERCSKEDPDITPLDFVFEHLLNLEEVEHFFEGEEEEEEGELPHQPFQIMQSPSQFVVALPKILQIELQPFIELAGNSVYPINKGNFYHYNYNTDIFRPPINV